MLTRRAGFSDELGEDTLVQEQIKRSSVSLSELAAASRSGNLVKIAGQSISISKFTHGVSTAFTISHECIVSKASRQSGKLQVPPMDGATSNCPLAIMAMTASQVGQL